MITIVEPKEYIAKLWGKQLPRAERSYRLMKYVLFLKYNSQILLQNVVTGQLVRLSKDESELLKRVPVKYSPIINDLIASHFLVAEGFDECKQVINLRDILKKISYANRPSKVHSYLIFPTTACNARCWYCFEKNFKPVTMTKETAKEVIDFIGAHCGGEMVRLWWFGGEPTIADDIIDQICNGLAKKKIPYFSDITTNGYLFDEAMIKRAKELWNLRQASISLDGTEANYNKIKSFVNISDNPYQRMMHNVELLFKNDIAVALRMNFDRRNYKDFEILLNEVKVRFPNNSKIKVYAHHINKEYSAKELKKAEQYYNKKCYELNEMACSSGFYSFKDLDLPHLNFEMCGTLNGTWFAITPEGSLVCCGEQLEQENVIGDIRKGITEFGILNEWQKYSGNLRCYSCQLFPFCCRMAHCKSSGFCFHKEELLKRFEQLMRTKSSVQ